MKLLHTADLHGKPERADEFIQSLRVLYDTGRREGVDLFALAGDLWDCVIRNTAGSRFIDMVEAVRRLADVAPVVLIYGTPTHDADGSLEVFLTLPSRYMITILEPGRTYFLLDDKSIDYKDRIGMRAKAILFGVPEPSKKWLAPYFDSTGEAEQAVRDGLRSLFTGLGAIRRQYPSLPCVMLYHGQVGGARLQNGDLLDNGSGIRPSVDDLAAVGADYIAMGDIHEPQQVGASIGLPAYYPGSAYPINFGETHEAGGNLVEIGHEIKDHLPEGVGSMFSESDFLHTVTRVPFGHPVNRTVRVRYTDGQYPMAKIEKGARTKYEITCTKEQQGLVDAAKGAVYGEIVQCCGAHRESTVTLNVLPTETVRAGDITGKTRLRDKVTLWGQNSSKATSETLLAKADEVEAEAARSGAIGTGARIRLDRLVLRGAIGIWKKSGLEEIDLDFTTIDEGLVALIGGNGAGKTTILENLHPWPELLTRDGTLKSHFRGRDAMRDLYWTDEATGTQYRALININAATASGTTEYYLYANGQPLPGIEGRKEGYIEAVDKLFGSKELYLRSAFVTQRQPKGLPDLADATPGQRKALFSALCGTDYLEAFKLIAKAKADQLDAQVAAKEQEIALLTARLPDRAELEADIATHTETLESAKEDKAVLEELGKHKAKAVDALSAQAAGNSQRREQAEEADRLALYAGTKADDAKTSIHTAQDAISRRPAAEKVLADVAYLNGQLTAQNEAYERHLEAVQSEAQQVAKLREDFDASQRQARDTAERTRQDHAQKVRAALDLEIQAKRAIDKARADLRAVRGDHQRVTGELSAPVADHCPACRQVLPDEARRHVHQTRNDLELRLAELTADINARVAEIDKAEARFQTTVQDRKALEANAPKAPDFPAFQAPASTVPTWNNAERQRLKDSLMWLDDTKARADISAADQAQVRIEELTKQLADLTATADRERARAEELRAGLRPELDAELAEAQRSLEAARASYRDTQGREATAAAALAQAQDKLNALAKDLLEVEALKTLLAKLQTEIAEWRLLELACSDKGIQALELDAVAPSIAAIANELLRGAFGSRYQLEFNTTRLSGTGARQKQIEDFLVQVLDAETGESQEIATLSGGEAVWIRRALYDAFGIIRARSTGLTFLTVFMDEADGALDPEQRLTYLRMLQAAHAQAGRRHSVMITHSVELQELIQARIEVARLKPRKVAVAA
jgi:DNA repair protein SbcC/Rad50